MPFLKTKNMENPKHYKRSCRVEGG